MHRNLPLLALAFTAACDLDAGMVDDELAPAYAFANMLPEPGSVRIEMGAPPSSARSAADLDDYYVLTRQASSGVNSFVESWLDIIHDIVGLTPRVDGEDAWIWGPFHQGEGGLAPTTEYFLVQQESDGSYSYVLIEAPRSDDENEDAYQPIVAGRVLGGSSVEDSYGWFAVDWDTASELDPMRDMVGRAVFAYDFSGTWTADVGGGVFVAAGLQGVAEGEADPFTAAYGYYRTPSGGGVMDLYVNNDLGGGADTEYWDVRSRWTADGPGRSDAQATGGDLGEVVVTVNDCWGESYETVYYTDDMGFGGTVGDESACAFASGSLPGDFPDWMLEVIED